MPRRKVTWIDRTNIYWRGHLRHGLADLANWIIEIDSSDISPRKTLLVETEELTHLVFPKLREREARRAAAIIGGELYKRGYRKVK